MTRFNQYPRRCESGPFRHNGVTRFGLGSRPNFSPHAAFRRGQWTGNSGPGAAFRFSRTGRPPPYRLVSTWDHHLQSGFQGHVPGPPSSTVPFLCRVSGMRARPIVNHYRGRPCQSSVNVSPEHTSRNLIQIHTTSSAAQSSENSHTETLLRTISNERSSCDRTEISEAAEEEQNPPTLSTETLPTTEKENECNRVAGTIEGTRELFDSSNSDDGPFTIVASVKSDVTQQDDNDVRDGDENSIDMSEDSFSQEGLKRDIFTEKREENMDFSQRGIDKENRTDDQTLSRHGMIQGTSETDSTRDVGYAAADCTEPLKSETTKDCLLKIGPEITQLFTKAAEIELPESTSAGLKLPTNTRLPSEYFGNTRAVGPEGSGRAPASGSGKEGTHEGENQVRTREPEATTRTRRNSSGSLLEDSNNWAGVDRTNSQSCSVFTFSTMASSQSSSLKTDSSKILIGLKNMRKIFKSVPFSAANSATFANGRESSATNTCSVAGCGTEKASDGIESFSAPHLGNSESTSEVNEESNETQSDEALDAQLVAPTDAQPHTTAQLVAQPHTTAQLVEHMGAQPHTTVQPNTDSHPHTIAQPTAHTDTQPEVHTDESDQAKSLTRVVEPDSPPAMDTDDDTLPLSQASSIGRAGMFNNDSLYLDESSSQGLLDESDDDLSEFDAPIASTRHQKQPSEQNAPQKRVTTLNELFQDYQSMATEINASKKLDSDLEKQKEELRRGLDAGGIDRFVEDQVGGSQELLPEHQQKLQTHYSIRKDTVSEVHPGVSVFDNRLFGRVYRLPGHCRLKDDFGFTPGSSMIDKLLTNMPQEMVQEMIQSDTISTCIRCISDPVPVMNWVFHLMSIHTNSLTTMRAHKLLHDIILTSSPDKVPWVPSLFEVAKVFVNYGASADSLFVIEEDEIQNEIHELRKIDDRDPLVNGEQRKENFRLENLKFVLQVVTWAVQHGSARYSQGELKSLILLVCRIALAKELTQGARTYDIEALLSALLDAIDDSIWIETETWLCVRVPMLDSHHHNKTFLTTIMPPTDRGLHLRRRLSFYMLQQLLGYETPKNPENITVQHLHQHVEKLRANNSTDYYELWSIVSLIDSCVGNESMNQTEREDLKQLMLMLGRVKTSIKERGLSNFDKTLVKDKLIILESKWKFRVQHRNFNQKSLFAYASSDRMQLLEEINVIPIQDDDSDDESITDEDGNEEMDGEDQNSDTSVESAKPDEGYAEEMEQS